MTRLFMGIDVGANGGIALIDETGLVLKVVPMPTTDADIIDMVSTPAREMPLVPVRAMIERVRSSPNMGITSAFTFGGSYRALKMALTAMKVPYDEVAPMVWQRHMDCLSGGDKNVTKGRAQQVFPKERITHAIADALLIAEYCRRREMSVPL